jgi:hypothetical protein
MDRVSPLSGKAGKSSLLEVNIVGDSLDHIYYC